MYANKLYLNIYCQTCSNILNFLYIFSPSVSFSFPLKGICKILLDAGKNMTSYCMLFLLKTCIFATHNVFILYKDS
ncbi:hypothetical protein KUTeg_014987 [Tegillarca granosa]|uniref:Uncharacterized protein n=1 Tax=Tegillarca granosa TaxID=220873 RepID=A0ABQ9ENU1_TEGGR|nr:hypothetical protein KUTeg_014987 [Tegillarca granosa]